MIIKFDKHCINWDDNMYYNECFIETVIRYYSTVDRLHCLNDIFDTIGLSKTIAGYSVVWDGPIKLSYEKFDDHFDIKIETMPTTVFYREKYFGLLQEEKNERKTEGETL